MRTWPKPFATMTSSEAARGRAELGDALGGDPSPWLPRLVLIEEGVFCLQIRRPTVESVGAMWSSHPLSCPGFLETKTITLPIGEALKLLRGQDNPELEIERRQRHHADEDERGRQRLQEIQATQERERLQRAEGERLHKEFRGDQFDALASWAKLAAHLALVHEKHGQHDLAADIRKLVGGEMLRSHDKYRTTPEYALHVGPARPDARWWP